LLDFTDTTRALPNEPELIGPDEIAVVALKNPFSFEQTRRIIKAGPNLTEIIAEMGVRLSTARTARVWIDDHAIEPSKWHLVRPKGGTTVSIRAVPQGGKGKNPLALILQVVLLIVIVVVAWYLAPMLGAAFAVGTAGNAALVAGVSVVGQLLIAAIAPPPNQSLGSDSAPASGVPESFSITGQRNRANPYGVVPQVLGRMRHFPFYAAKPYTEIVGNDQYLRMLFCFGYGPLSLSEHRIGDTLLTNFVGYEIEVKEGWPDDTACTLYPGTVNELDVSATFESADGWQLRTTEPDTDEIVIDWIFTGGLYTVNTDGDYVPNGAHCYVEIAPAGTPYFYSPTWSNTEAHPNVDEAGDIFDTPGFVHWNQKRRGVYRVSGRILVPRGQYDVRLRNPLNFTTLVNSVDRYYWSVLRSIKNEHPVSESMRVGKCWVALRMKASNQLSGVIETYSAVAQTIVERYSSSGSPTWNTMLSRTPADLLCHVLRKSANRNPVADADLDLSEIESWNADCVLYGWKYDNVIDQAQSVYTLCKDIAAAGNASFQPMKDGKYSIVRDNVKSTIAQHFSPRNSWGYVGTRIFADPVHALRVRFINQDSWAVDSQIVYDEGYTAANATNIQDFQMPGKLDSVEVWKFARRYLAILRLRPEIHRFETGIDNLRCQRGDRIKFGHDVPLIGLGSGRIKSVTTDGSGNCTAVTVDETFTMVTGSTYSARIRTSAGADVYASVVLELGDVTSLTFSPVIAAADCPAAGDLLFFGESELETVDLVVQRIVPKLNHTATIEAVAYAVAIQSADSGSPVPGFESSISTQLLIPYPPAIAYTRSDESAIVRYPSGSLELGIMAYFAPVAGTAPQPDYYEAQFRETGTGDWSTGFTAPYGAMQIRMAPVEQGGIYDYRVRAIKNTAGSSGWTLVESHTVVGKTTLPPDVTNFAGSQNVNVVVMTWDEVTVIDLKGYDIRYGLEAGGFDGATRLDPVTRGQEMTTAQVPPGTWRFWIKAVDADDNLSSSAAYFDLEVTSENPVVFQTAEAPRWQGSKAGCFYHAVDNTLCAQSQSLASALGWEVFDSYCPNPVSEFTYTGLEIDYGFDTSAGRIYGPITAALGEGESGAAEPIFQLDYRLAAGSYDGYENWTIGTASARYLSPRLRVDMNTGRAYVSAFTPTVDSPRRSEAQTVTLDAAGSAVTWTTQFFAAPAVTVTPVSTSAIFGVANSITETGATVRLFNTSGTGVAGSANVVAQGA